jgi:hypothetical protein
MEKKNCGIPNYLKDDFKALGFRRLGENKKVSERGWSLKNHVSLRIQPSSSSAPETVLFP